MRNTFGGFTFWVGIILIGLSFWLKDISEPLYKTGWLVLIVGFVIILAQSILAVQKKNSKK